MEVQTSFTEIKRQPCQILLIALKVMLLPLLLSFLLFFPAAPIKLYPQLIQSTLNTDDYSLVRILEHDSDCFTEGLQYNSKGKLVQSCGPIPIFSHLKFYDGQLTGFQKKFEAKDYFYQGITFLNGSMYLLTYQNKTIIKFEKEGEAGQGQPYLVKGTKELWGAASNGSHLFVSNGSARLLVYSQSLQLVGHLVIKNKNGSNWSKQTNQLEFDPDTNLFYANSWFDTRMIIFNQEGIIQRIVQLKPLLEYQKTHTTVNSRQKCLNGIAVRNGEILVTGKLFSNAFIIKLT